MRNNIIKRMVKQVFTSSTALVLLAARLCAAETPLVDLSDDTTRQTVVDKEPGKYLGHVSTLLLDDGKTIFAAYPHGHGTGAIILKRSDDGGKTWSERLKTPMSWETSLNTPTLYKTTDAAGKKRLLLFSGPFDTLHKGSLSGPIRLAVSEDNGANWSQLKPIGNYGGIVAMGDVIKLKNGDYAAFYHDYDFKQKTPAEIEKHSIIFQTISHDGGATWGSPRPIATKDGAFLCEPGAVRSPDGKQIALLLRENTHQSTAFAVFSDDEGKTWSEPRPLPMALQGDRHVARYTSAGDLVISFRDRDPHSPTNNSWVAWIGKYDDLVKGTPAKYRVLLKRNLYGADCGYSGVAVLPDDTIVATSYGHWADGEEPYIVSTRFKVAELKDLETAGTAQ